MPETTPSALIVCSFAAMLAGSLAGCIGDLKPSETGVYCTDIAFASVNIDVVDQDGAPLSPTTIGYTLDGGESLPAECIDDDCTSFAAAWEAAGDFIVTATWTEDTADPCCWFEDYASQSVTVGMTEDGCHVVPESMTITLDTTLLACADSEECG